MTKIFDNNVYLTIVVSVFNEELSLKKFHEELATQLKKINNSIEIIYVNDGSLDDSLSILEEISSREQNVKVISLSRNYGHEAAMIAGIDNSKGKYTICLDADLQHPPSLIHEMIAKAEKGMDIVLTKRKADYKNRLFIKLFSTLFYKVINWISPVKFEKNVSDFFLVSNKVTSILKKDFRERIRFLRGYIQFIGFKKDYIEYRAPKRFDGDSKYNFSSLFNLSTDAIVSFSKAPLKLGLSIGIIGLILSLIIGGYSLIMHFIEDTPSGYTTVIMTITLIASIQFILIGFIGIYIGYLFDEIKRRPIYIIDKKIPNDSL